VLAVDAEAGVVAVVAAVVERAALVLMGAGRAAREPAVACDSLIPANR
jgi:hypothetical protein